MKQILMGLLIICTFFLGIYGVVLCPNFGIGILIGCGAFFVLIIAYVIGALVRYELGWDKDLKI